MATPFAHTHVSHVHVLKTGRRRSKSLTLPKFDEEDTTGHSIRQNKHDGQLENEEQQQQDKEDHHQPVVTRVAVVNNTPTTKKHSLSKAATSFSLKKQISSTTSKTPAAEEHEQYQPAVTQVGRTAMTMSMKKPTSTTEASSIALKRDVTSISSNSTPSQENEEHHGNQPQVIRIPRSELALPLKRQISTKTCKSSNPNFSTTGKNSNLNSSQTSSYPLASSSINLISKSEIIDQDFYLDDNTGHAQRNDTKHHGKINISGRERYSTNHYPGFSGRSSASFMTAIIAIIIGVIAFAFALTSLILVLLLRSTVNAELGSNSTTSGSSSSGSGTWPSGCSAYTTIDDPTRNVNQPGYALGCDNTAPFLNRTTPVWIRFVGTGGTTIPLTSPGINICGSTGTGWYDGNMPTTTGAITNGTACFTWYTSVCQYSQMISVANCGSFYIYLLPPAPACMMRYCTI